MKPADLPTLLIAFLSTAEGGEPAPVGVRGREGGDGAGGADDGRRADPHHPRQGRHRRRRPQGDHLHRLLQGMYRSWLSDTWVKLTQI